MITTGSTQITAGLGEIKVSKDPDVVLGCLGLGSCVAVAVYDPVAKAGGMAHVVLPDSTNRSESKDGRYADLAIPRLLAEVANLGASTNRLVVKITGGAQMSLAPGLNDSFKIGPENVDAVLTALSKEGITPAAADTGGNKGRSVKLSIQTGKLLLSSAGADSIEL